MEETHNYCPWRLISSGEKNYHYKCERVEWSESMDVIGVISTENVVEVDRLGPKPKVQKMFVKDEKSSNPISFAFHQSGIYIYIYIGNYCAIGYQNGRICLIQTDSGKTIVTLDWIPKMPKPIVCLCWKNIRSDGLDNKAKNIIKSYTYIKENLKLMPEITSTKIWLPKESFLSQMETDSYLIGAEWEGNIIISCYGVFPIVKYNLKSQLETQFSDVLNLHGDGILVRKIRMFDDGSAFFCLIEKMGGNIIAIVDSFILNLRNTQIMKISRIFTLMDELILFIDSHVESCHNQWKKLIQSIVIKMCYSEIEIERIKELISKPKQEEANIPPEYLHYLKYPISRASLQKDLLKYVSEGFLSPLLGHFIKEEITDCKILPNLDEKLNNLSKSLQEVIQNAIIPALQRVIMYADEISCTAKIKEIYGMLGINPQLFTNFNECLSALYIKMEGLLLDITEAKINYHNLFQFLNQSVLKFSRGKEIENTKNHITKEQGKYDDERLLNLLQSEYSFYSKNVSDNWDMTEDRRKYEQVVNMKLIGRDVEILLKCFPDINTQLLYHRNPVFNNTKRTDTTNFPKFITEQRKLLQSGGLMAKLGFKPVSGVKYILQRMKQELEKIYVQPLKSISQYIQITKIIDFSEGSLSISILDIFTMNEEKYIVIGCSVKERNRNYLAFVEVSEMEIRLALVNISDPAEYSVERNIKEGSFHTNEQFILLIKDINTTPHIIPMVSPNTSQNLSTIGHKVMLFDIAKLNYTLMETDSEETKNYENIADLIHAYIASDGKVQDLDCAEEDLVGDCINVNSLSSGHRGFFGLITGKSMFNIFEISDVQDLTLWNN